MCVILKQKEGLALNCSAGQYNLESDEARNLERPNSATRILSHVLHSFKESRDLKKNLIGSAIK